MCRTDGNVMDERNDCFVIAYDFVWFLAKLLLLSLKTVLYR